ncbi:MAG: hypothetical protein R3E95_03270 [Thiolinea sp.]
MLPVNLSGRRQRNAEKQLTDCFRQLSSQDQETLLRFAEFLVASGETVPADPISTEPLNIPRPAEESVVKAIKRLTATYPMLNKDKLLHKTSDLMAAHVINGRAAAEVIDELQVLFDEHYQHFKNDLAQNG